MSPFHQRLLRRYSKSKYGSSIAALGATLATLFVICIPLFVVGTLAASQVSVALNDLQGQSSAEVLAKVDDALVPLLNKIGVKDFDTQTWWSDNKQEIISSLRAPTTKFVGQTGTAGFTFVVALLSMFFLLRDSKALRKPFHYFSGLSNDRAETMLSKLSTTVHAVFKGTVLVAILQGTIMGITYAVLGVPNSALLGIISIVLCIIPLVGAPVIYLPVGLLFLAQGQTNKALIIFGVGFLIVSQIDNLLKPFLIGNQVSLHPLAIFFFVLGGITMFGPVGLMVGPMILVIILSVYDYLVELTQHEPTPADITI